MSTANWIPVGEDLPGPSRDPEMDGDSDYVLVWDGVWMDIGYYDYTSQCAPRWMSYCGYPITHWALLPSPPHETLD